MNKDDGLRRDIEKLLAASTPSAAAGRVPGQLDFDATVRRLRRLSADDLAGKLQTAGFALEPIAAPPDIGDIEFSCATCMYFERHRRFCNLPELMLPVEPVWSCLIWRI